MELDGLVTHWLSLPDLADAIGEPLAKVRQMLREGRIVAVERGRPPVKQVPADLVHDGRLVKGLAGALTVLRDAGYSDVEALRWLLTDDPAIPGRPVDAMAAGRDTAVKRRAQVLAF
ncbi:MAG TPA: Rv2175c family DNA-binding protein [Mycobacteriales bacterium]|nr:Rv2175c family DNA-binding protein [Mycobacteriales bacterium]